MTMKAPAVKERSVRDKLILAAASAWIYHDRKEAARFAKLMKQRKQQQVSSSGKWRSTGDGYIKYSYPPALRASVQRVLDHYGIEEKFMYDDKDMKLLIREFPALFGVGSNITSKKSKRR